MTPARDKASSQPSRRRNSNSLSDADSGLRQPLGVPQGTLPSPILPRKDIQAMVTPSGASSALSTAPTLLHRDVVVRGHLSSLPGTPVLPSPSVLDVSEPNVSATDASMPVEGTPAGRVASLSEISIGLAVHSVLGQANFEPVGVARSNAESFLRSAGARSPLPIVEFGSSSLLDSGTAEQGHLPASQQLLQPLPQPQQPPTSSLSLQEQLFSASLLQLPPQQPPQLPQSFQPQQLLPPLLQPQQPPTSLLSLQEQQPSASLLHPPVTVVCT